MQDHGYWKLGSYRVGLYRAEADREDPRKRWIVQMSDGSEDVWLFAFVRTRANGWPGVMIYFLSWSLAIFRRKAGAKFIRPDAPLIMAALTALCGIAWKIWLT